MVMRGKPHAFQLLILIVVAAGPAAAGAAPGGSELGELSVADRHEAAATQADAIAVELASTAGWRMDDEFDAPDRLKPGVMYGERTVIADDIVHYSFLVRTGCGPRDVIGLHRVVKERRRFVPIRTSQSIFLQHGDGKTFTGMFLPGQLSPHTDDDFGIAVFLARNDVDVWGIDQAWTLVPADTTDLAFMETWGLQRQVDDLSLAMRIARFARLHTGSGLGKMILSGYSSGTATGYAMINQEAPLPAALRQVSGFIPVDFGPTSDIEDWQSIMCGYAWWYGELMDAGEFGYATGFPDLGYLARNDPDGPSPILEGFTNFDAAMFMGAGPIFGYGVIHYLGGVWGDGMPVDFQFLTIDQWLDFLEVAPPYEATLFSLDYSAWVCGAVDLPFDDHFADVQVPILNVAAAGGLGETTLHTPTLLGSDDVTYLMAGVMPPEEAAYDTGHIDLFIADNAPGLVWQPILDWIEAHSD